jgi:hypothetical protein
VALRGRDTGTPLGGGAGLRNVVVGRRKDGSCGFFRRGVELAPPRVSPRVFPRGTPLECREGVPLVFMRGGSVTPGGRVSARCCLRKCGSAGRLPRGVELGVRLCSPREFPRDFPLVLQLGNPLVSPRESDEWLSRFGVCTLRYFERQQYLYAVSF